MKPCYELRLLIPQNDDKLLGWVRLFLGYLRNFTEGNLSTPYIVNKNPFIGRELFLENNFISRHSTHTYGLWVYFFNLFPRYLCASPFDDGTV